MSGRHGTAHHLYVPAESRVHALASEAKLAALLVFVMAVAVTPRHAVAVFALDALVLLAIFVLAHLPLVVLARLAAIVPFVAFALLVPLVAGGEQVDVLGVSLSLEGLWATWNIVAKATLGALASIIVSATTPFPDILRGLGRLRVPAVIVAIIAFMFRYLDLLSGQLSRMRTAMTARGHDPRWLWQARPVASSVGVLFVRSYERGERIHEAMVARGFTGTMPELDERRAGRGDWLAAATPALIAIFGGVAAFTIGAR